MLKLSIPQASEIPIHYNLIFLFRTRCTCFTSCGKEYTITDPSILGMTTEEFVSLTPVKAKLVIADKDITSLQLIQ